MPQSCRNQSVELIIHRDLARPGPASSRAHPREEPLCAGGLVLDTAPKVSGELRAARQKQQKFAVGRNGPAGHAGTVRAESYFKSGSWDELV